jgi:hypothetical protein
LMRATCFIVPHRVNDGASFSLRETQLDADAALALAVLVPLLGCGEEAAALAFDGLADCADSTLATTVLRRIAKEERVHDGLMRGIVGMLPTPPDQSVMLRAARRLHIQLGRGGAAVHLARIAALDAAVCLILSRVIRPGLPVSGDTQICATLGRIRGDEAKHVDWARRLALAGGITKMQRDAAAGAREALANVLQLAADAFEVLQVDPAALDRDVRTLPNGLLAA